MKNGFLGKWKIISMEMWDRDYIDLVEPGFISFEKGGQGEFVFGVVTGWMSYSYGQSTANFTWEGSDEGDEVRGEGWAEFEDDKSDILTGSIEFHSGDKSEFTARKF